MIDRDLGDRLQRVRARIAAAAERAGRPAEAVEILPVTKGHPPEVVERVAALGMDRIGENRVGEAAEKQALLGRLDLRWHMIGHLQRNKAGDALALFDEIESVDSLRLARRLQRLVERERGTPVGVLVQVNASGEESKGGFPVEEAEEAVAAIASLAGLRPRGLMTMAPWTDDEAVLRRTFVRMREALERCRGIAGFAPEVLSMGMSNDFEIAVEEGSTRVRLGTVLLGERPE